MAIQHLDAAADRELSELVACTLSETNLKTQRERWINLGENFGIARHETADGLLLTFKDHPAVAAELEALVQVENDCCSWAAWTVERDKDGTLVMAAHSQGEGIATLHDMFTKEATPWKSSSECCEPLDDLRHGGCSRSERPDAAVSDSASLASTWHRTPDSP